MITLKARGQLHGAIQLLAAIGISYIQPRSDDSHTALLWSPEDHAFLSHRFGADRSLQVRLKPDDLEVSFISNEKVVDTFGLVGITLKDAFNRLKISLKSSGLNENLFTLEKHYELPDYIPGNETVMRGNIDGLTALSKAYALAYQAFSSIKSEDPRVGALLTWPHHFDMAILTSLSTDSKGQLTKSIGTGFSPGDDSINEPYFYVTAWPGPTKTMVDAYPLRYGKWVTQDWTGMILPLADITNKNPDGQRFMLAAFLAEARGLAMKLA